MKKFFIKRKAFLFTALFFLSLVFLMFGVNFLPSVANAKEITSIKITIDSLSYNSYDLPFGVKGRTYPVFDCYAVDNNGNNVTNVDVLVYAPDGQLVSIVNDRFATDYEGEYKVEYTASVGGVQALRTLKVNVVDESEYTAISYTINDSIVDSSNTGDKVFIFDNEPTGGIGVIDVDMDIEYSGDYVCEEVEVYDLGADKFFIPIVSGNYLLKYSLTDITGEPVIVSKEIVINDSGLPVINEPSFPSVYEVDETINFPRVESVLYDNGKIIYLPVKIFVNDTDVSVNAAYTPSVAGDYTVKYISENPFEATEQSTEIVKQVKVLAKRSASEPIINSNLYLDGLTTSYRGKGDGTLESYVYLLNADGTKNNAEMRFKNKIPAEFLSINLGVETTLYNYSSIDLKFTDSVKGNHFIIISLKKTANDEELDVFFKDKFVGKINSSSFNVSYDYLSKSFVCADVTLFAPNTYNNGDEFSGFDSGFAYLSLNLNGISGQSQLKLYEIATQKINNAIKDNVAPIIVQGRFTGVYVTDIGKTVTLPKLDTFDLLSDKVELTLKITSPSGIKIYEGEITSDYQLTVEEYGKYEVSYIAKDKAGKTKPFNCAINVMDRIPPMISVKHIDNVKVGQKVNFPNATIVDNNDSIYITWISVTYGNYLKETVVDGLYKFKTAGTYVIEYGASDNDGNYTVYKYTIKCE